MDLQVVRSNEDLNPKLFRIVALTVEKTFVPLLHGVTLLLSLVVLAVIFMILIDKSLEKYTVASEE